MTGGRRAGFLEKKGRIVTIRPGEAKIIERSSEPHHYSLSCGVHVGKQRDKHGVVADQ